MSLKETADTKSGQIHAKDKYPGILPASMVVLQSIVRKYRTIDLIPGAGAVLDVTYTQYFHGG